MRQRIYLVLLALLMMVSFSGSARGADTPTTGEFGLPAFFAVMSDGAAGEYLLVPRNVEIRSEGRTADGWVHRNYDASFEIRAWSAGVDGPEPGGLLARGQFEALKTHRPADAVGGYFEGVFDVTAGRSPFSPGKNGNFSGPFPNEGFEALTWGRVTWSAIRDFGLTGTDGVSWGAVKSRFR